jgi:nucleoside-diphosphate-sugar epimerase
LKVEGRDSELAKDELHIVIGASGGIGNAIIRELAALGKQVRGVNRSGKADVPEGVEVVKGDVVDHASARRVCKGAAVIYHCVNAPYDDWPRLFPPITEGVIEGAASAGAKLVFCDNLYMYGPVSEPIREDLHYKATGRKGRTRAEVATMIMEAHKSGKIRATIGRASDYYGPRTGMGQYLFGPVLMGEAVTVFGNPDAPHTYTYSLDFARGLILLGEREEALGEAWHIPSAETLTTRQFYELAFEEAEKEPKFNIIPRAVVEAQASENPMMREIEEMLYEYEEPFIMDHSKFEQAFGSDTTPHREGIRQTLEWLRVTAE